MLIYFNIFDCDKNILNRINATCERACMATAGDKYYTEFFKTITDYNYRNNNPIPNSNILEAIHKFMEEEPIVDANNVTTDTLWHISNTQRGNANIIFTSEKLDKSDDLVDTVKKLTIKYSKYSE